MRKVTQEFANDVITTAVEGGIGYWARISEYHWRNGIPTTAMIEPLDPMDQWPLAQLDRVLVQKGIDALAEGNIKVAPDILGAILVSVVRPDDYDIDATAADVIVQAGLFNDIIYG